MSIKDPGFVEKYIEKIVLAVAALAALAIIWFYVLGQPYTVEVNSGRGPARVASPSDINKIVYDASQELDLALKGPGSIKRLAVPDYFTDMRQRSQAPPLSRSSYPIALGPLGLQYGIDGGGPGSSGPSYVLPRPDAPSTPLVHADFAVLAEEPNVKYLPQLLQLLGDRKPRDFRYVTASATFDLQGWFKSLRATTPRIPEEWWRGYGLTFVRLERQALNTRTGEWGDITDVPPVPGQVAVEGAGRKWTVNRITLALRVIRSRQNVIALAPFPAVTVARPYTPPGIDVSKLTDIQRLKVQEILTQINALEQQMATEAIESMRDPADQATPTPDADPNIDTGEVNLVPIPDMTSGAESETQNQLNELHRQLDWVLQGNDLSTLPPLNPTGTPGTPGSPGMFGSSGVPGTGWRPGGPRPVGTPAPTHSPVTAVPSGKIQLRVHDLTPAPGKTYRYRVVVGLYNPLYRRGGTLEQKNAPYNRLSVVSVPSEWSEPVQIWPELPYYLSSASASSRPVVARWEVYRIFNGQWWRKEFEARPGDFIGGSARLKAGELEYEVPMIERAALVDVETIDTALGTTTQRAVVLDLATGRLFERSLASDPSNPMRRQIKGEMDAREAARRAAEAAAKALENPVQPPEPIDIEPPMIPPLGPNGKPLIP